MNEETSAFRFPPLLVNLPAISAISIPVRAAYPWSTLCFEHSFRMALMRDEQGMFHDRLAAGVLSPLTQYRFTQRVCDTKE
jgi:hypothetical protein